MTPAQARRRVRTGLAGELRKGCVFHDVSTIPGVERWEVDQVATDDLLTRAADFLDALPGQEQGDIGSSRESSTATGSSLEEWEIANAHFLTSEWNCLGDQMFHTAVRVPFGGPMVLVFAETTEDEYEIARAIQATLSRAPQVERERSRDAPNPLPQQTGGGWRPTHRHVKRGTDYQVIAEGELQWATQVIGELADGQPVTIYRGPSGAWWVRPTAEFNDGRFLPAPPPPGGDKP